MMIFALCVFLWNLALLWAFEVVNWITMIQKHRQGWWPSARVWVTAPGLKIQHFPKTGSIWADLFGWRGLRLMFTTQSLYVVKRNGDKPTTRLLSLGSSGARENIQIGKLGINMLQRRRRGDDILTVHWGWRKVREWVLRPKRYITGATR